MEYNLESAIRTRETVIEMLEQRGFSVPYSIKNISRDRFNIMISELYNAKKKSYANNLLDIHIENYDDNGNIMQAYVAWLPVKKTVKNLTRDIATSVTRYRDTCNPGVNSALPVNGISEIEYEELPNDFPSAKSSQEISGTVTVLSP